jgi:hypothetical protein
MRERSEYYFVGDKLEPSGTVLWSDAKADRGTFQDENSILSVTGTHDRLPFGNGLSALGCTSSFC